MDVEAAGIVHFGPGFAHPPYTFLEFGQFGVGDDGAALGDGLGGHGQAQVDVGRRLPRVEGGIEAAKLHRAPVEHRVQVQGVVAGAIVVGGAVIGAALVPDVLQHCQVFRLVAPEKTKPRKGAVNSMDRETFEKEMQILFENPDPAATKAWLTYANELEQDGVCDAADFRRVVHKELVSIQKEFGQEIAERLYNGGKEFTFNPFELRGAAGFLQKGSPMAEVIGKALEGLCEGDGPVPKRPKSKKIVR